MGIGDNMQIMRPNRWNDEGFTLVEILIAMAITLVVMGSIFTPVLIIALIGMIAAALGPGM